MVVGQEYGMRIEGKQRAITRVHLEARYTMIHQASGLGSRYYGDREHPPRNPHMRGTTSALRILFGNGLGPDWESEFVDTAEGRRFQVFDAFALVNVLLCSAGPPMSSQGRSSSVMRRNCLEHFRATLRILQPTVVILQGGGVASWTAPVFGIIREHSHFLAEATYDGGRALLCRFSHPSARAPNRWGDRLDSPYLIKVVEPTLREAVLKAP
jgi:hypothetical protein